MSFKQERCPWVRQAEKPGRERFRRIPPAVETFVEAPLDFTIHEQLEGEWEIVAGNSNGRSIVLTSIRCQLFGSPNN
ncbi:MAG: hypothetical protein MPJ50_18365 [Pirellulales bacterium]|nr:hypothetical protein [Pirellulales bacterium]